MPNRSAIGLLLDDPTLLPTLILPGLQRVTNPKLVSTPCADRRGLRFFWYINGQVLLPQHPATSGDSMTATQQKIILLQKKDR